MTLDLAVISWIEHQRHRLKKEEEKKNSQNRHPENQRELCTKRHYQQNKNASHRIGENICKSYIKQGINIQNM